jgi:putative ABC transport system ATP-binding protein/lipoprotein-releasing system ATP-binding protein
MMIEAKGVTKRYKTGGREIIAVDDVTFRCKRGEFITIVGHSGSGKSTFLSLLGGLTKPNSGEISIDDVDIISLDDNRLSEFRNKKINFIFQFASLIPTLTVLDNITLPAFFGAARGSKAAKRKEALELLEMLGIADKMKSYPSDLSGGQQRRVAIARSFINNPEIILADEPTGDLDEETEAEVIKIFKKMNEEKGITFLVVTHDTAIASKAKRTMRMHYGRLEELKA